MRLAVYNLDLDAMRKLLEAGADPNEQDRDGRTPLHILVDGYGVGVVRLFIEFGADKNAADKTGVTPMQLATPDVTAVLADKGPQADLMAFVEKGDLAGVKGLLEKDPQLVYAVAGADRTALHVAAFAGRKDIAELLLDKGADPKRSDARGMTPLHDAARRGYPQVAELLLARGAPVEAKTKDAGATPIICVFWLMNSVDREGTANVLLTRNPDLKVRDASGMTALHWAIAAGSRTAVRTMVEKGADLQARDNEGNTPLFQAVFRNDMDLLRYLLDKGSNIQVADKAGETALHHAISNGHGEIAELLIGRGADVNACDRMKRTPLWKVLEKPWLFRYGKPVGVEHHVPMAELLLKHGADVNAADIDGMTPLGHCLAIKYDEITEFLRKHGAK
jgi:ankyrin repeat protein